jgi:hypothetical protein
MEWEVTAEMSEKTWIQSIMSKKTVRRVTRTFLRTRLTGLARARFSDESADHAST